MEKLSKVAKALAKNNTPEQIRFMANELPRGGALMQMNGPDQALVLRTVKMLYQILNDQLKQACQLLKYPLNQLEWKDSEPLQTVAEVYQGLEATEWYQGQLGMMLMSSGHPWLEITT